MLVGAQLRRLREAAEISRSAAGYAIRGSDSKISRLELGRTGFKARDVADLLTLYGVGDAAERETLLSLVEQANRPAWWQPYADAVPSWFEPYLGLEQDASVIRSWEPRFVPGLLQTEDYARALIAPHHGVPGAEVERGVRLRLLRQRVVTGPEPARLWAVVDEAVLRRPIGGPAVMRAQLRHLIEMAALPHVTVQVMPFGHGGHAALGGPVAILRFPACDLPDVVYLEHLHGATYPDKPAEVNQYWDVMNRLSIEAEGPRASVATLRRVLDET
ncbi:helix-turn-helix transcriptional regulator [Sphaerisporangium sp. TRM90804]|uniref:helix-turn-helix domain-containing protein n=1 Tax=Sphaerisporangium sp. TRM90804 TaxID=3031113 RepID=UPI0024491F85|nr:helix-turn-helix transcriptional regulator [Sphaerisporangium sp. TRM90804]MDH2427340.1 helix-turn-helix transcriptional regulator [Sphaerisporangium sp. TRM90804]